MESLALKHNAIHVQLIRCFILDHQVWSLKYNTMSHLNYSHSFCPQLLSTRSCSFVIMLVAQHNKNQNLVNVVTGCQTQCHTFNPLLHTRSSSLISEVQYLAQFIHSSILTLFNTIEMVTLAVQIQCHTLDYYYHQQ